MVFVDTLWWLKLGHRLMYSGLQEHTDPAVSCIPLRNSPDTVYMLVYNLIDILDNFITDHSSCLFIFYIKTLKTIF